MRNGIVALAISTLLEVTAPAYAQQYYNRNYETRAVNQTYERAVRRDSSQDWRRYANYDYDRLEVGQKGYDADRYYRPARFYKRHRMAMNDRIYRGANGRFYCRRNDGTTGLIVSGLTSSGADEVIAKGQSSLLRTLIGSSGSPTLGQAIDRGKVVCH